MRLATAAAGPAVREDRHLARREFLRARQIAERRGVQNCAQRLPRLMRILVVEDDLILADGLAHTLRGMSHAVDCVATGLDADQTLAAEEYDFVILDIELPKFDGLEVLRRLRRAGCGQGHRP